jgi:hypothetical protein
MIDFKLEKQNKVKIKMPDIIQGDGFGAQPGQPKPADDKAAQPNNETIDDKVPQPAEGTPEQRLKIDADAEIFHYFMNHLDIIGMEGSLSDEHAVALTLFFDGLTFVNIDEDCYPKYSLPVPAPEVVQEFMRHPNVLGDLAEISDFYNDTDLLKDPQQLNEYVPGIGSFFNHVDGEQRYIHPYIAAMREKGVVRDVMAVAISKRGVVDPMRVDRVSWDSITSLNADEKKTFLLARNQYIQKNGVPKRDEIYDVLREYKCGKLREVVDSINAANEFFNQRQIAIRTKYKKR